MDAQKNPRRPTTNNHVDRSIVKLCLVKDTLDRRDRLLEHVTEQLLKPRPRERRVEANAAVHSWSTSINAFASTTGSASTLARSPKEMDSARIPAGVHLVLPLGLVDEAHHNPAVKVPAKVHVTRHRLGLKDAFVGRLERDIKRTPHGQRHRSSCTPIR